MRGLGTLLPLALLAVGCGGGGGSSNSHPTNQGILWLSWTVQGQAVSDSTCKSIDHLVLTMDTPVGAVEIEPIPCLRGLGWEYDGLPEGFNVVILDAFDAQGTLTLEGVANVTVDDTKPPMPAPVDLQLPH